ncbi:MAG TPA: gamma-glutamyltransferase family protein [Gaiellales bacterium]
MRRSSAVAAEAMAATSHPLATRAALRVLEDGGNAVDAAVTAAAVLCVVEPMSTGIGGDLFAIVWDDDAPHGLNASGRSPAGIDPGSLTEIPISGPRSVTVPGAVSGWAALLQRFGSIGLDRCLAPAIDAAERGFAVTPVIAGAWEVLARALTDPEARRVFGRAPRVGDVVQLPDLARSLRLLASDGPGALYDGPLGEAICGASWLERSDLAAHAPEWVEPLRLRHRGAEVLELPPNGQGAVALQAMALVEPLTPRDLADRVHLQAEALKLAFADGYGQISDRPLPDGFLDAAYVAERRALIDRDAARSPGAGALPRGGTVYLCCVDGERRGCSLIQSVYYGFGSGVVAPGTGIALQNRGGSFTLEPGHPNRFAPGTRPFHTIIPGLLVRDGALLGPFGVMGGHFQPQGHLQVVEQLLAEGADPQAALDAPRFRLDLEAGAWTLALEPPLWPLEGELVRRGHRVLRDPDLGGFGGGQAILVNGASLIGGSEPRKDGYAAGI